MRNFTNRKKVRGWTRRIKKLGCFSERFSDMSVDRLESRGSDYVKLWIDPWYRLEKRNPPLWFYNLALDELDKIYRNWEAVMQKDGRPYDLQLWVSHPNTMGSEVVVDLVENPGDRRDNYFEILPDNLPFPAHRYTGKRHFNPENYDWQLAHQYDYVYKVLDGITIAEENELIRQGYIGKAIETDLETDTLYTKPMNKIWIGRLKKAN